MALVQGKEGTALAGPYAAAKVGLIALAKTAGKELAAEGILVNAVTPTVVRTEMERSLTAERRAGLLARIPRERFLGPEEVAACDRVFRDTSRSIARVLDSRGEGVGGAMLMLRFDAGAMPAITGLLAEALRQPRITGAHPCRTDEDASAERSAESQNRFDIKLPRAASNRSRPPIRPHWPK